MPGPLIWFSQHIYLILSITQYTCFSVHVSARKASQVLGILGLTSYAGFITVDEQYNSNMYFWFFKAQVYT